MTDLRIAVIDDDYFKREHMAQELDRSPHIAVVHALDQDTARAWTRDQWEGLDFAIVDVLDAHAPGELGTDFFSGIGALEVLRDLDVRTIAITPHRHHPLVEQRIFQAGANFLYRTWEVNDLDLLVDALLHPRHDHAPQPISANVLTRLGARNARLNLAVNVYENSRLHRRLRADSSHANIGLPRRTIDQLTRRIGRITGFTGPLDSGSYPDPRWPAVRDHLLRLLGRLDAPPTDSDHRQL